MIYTNLDFLSGVAEGNNEIMQDMIETFIDQVPDFINNLNFFYNNRQFVSLGKEVHKTKSSLQIMGMSDLEKEMKIFHQKAMEGIDIESYPVHIEHFVNQCKGAIIELRAELEQLQPA